MTKVEWLSFMVQKKLLGRSDVFVNGQLYMRRWLIGPTWLPGIRIHNILKSDAAFELHDHPFDFVSFILSGGYNEIRGEALDGVPASSTLRRKEYHQPLTFVRRKAEDLHRILLKPTVVTIDGRQVLRETPAWTIVFRGKYRREWGFLTNNGWQNWREYIAAKHETRRNTVSGGFVAKSST